VALIPMGMAMVSSVQFEDDVAVGKHHAKGDMLGNFLFGGSDFVMVLQQQAGFELTAPKDAAGDGAYAHLLMGEAYGKLTGAGH
jgi:phosphatidylserine decarboxylase